jgi:hypothetical protein
VLFEEDWEPELLCHTWQTNLGEKLVVRDFIEVDVVDQDVDISRGHSYRVIVFENCYNCISH